MNLLAGFRIDDGDDAIGAASGRPQQRVVWHGAGIGDPDLPLLVELECGGRDLQACAMRLTPLAMDADVESGHRHCGQCAARSGTTETWIAPPSPCPPMVSSARSV